MPEQVPQHVKPRICLIDAAVVIGSIPSWQPLGIIRNKVLRLLVGEGGCLSNDSLEMFVICSHGFGADDLADFEQGRLHISSNPCRPVGVDTELVDDESKLRR